MIIFEAIATRASTTSLLLLMLKVVVKIVDVPGDYKSVFFVEYSWI
ncbi:hypothetical protein [Okeania sp. SIO1I7]|nr:hypothetical protein [Okeania sp. SIO1I7]NET24168.1 hypothetical protein [Okeania sp. SIO1I7]